MDKSQLQWDGYYINLDRSPLRRAEIEKQIKARNLSGQYRRFSAIDGRFLETSSSLGKGEVGIFKSHLELIRTAANSSTTTHIIEDDILFSKYTAPFVSSLMNSGLLENFDVFVTDTGFAPNARQYRSFRSQMPQHLSDSNKSDIKILDISAVYRWGMTSYIVSPSGARKFLAVAEQEWLRGPRLPIDRVLERAARARQLSIGCSFPFVTWLDMASADLSSADRSDEVPLLQTVQRLARHPFFIERNVSGYLVPHLRQSLSKVHQQRFDRFTPREKLALRFAQFLLEESANVSDPIN
jgi:GR25 family glycosyltransferase involved in LPS biosynthesis